jgi:UDPglucose 6-dehydrogenase
MKIAMIGCGKLGLPCAEVMYGAHDVVGYDVIKNPLAKIKMLDTIEEAVVDRDIVFIAVPTPHDPAYDGRYPTAHLEPKDFDYSIVKNCIIEANKHMNPNQLLVLISTVLPGTTRREFIPLVTNTRFVYNPYLIAMGSVAWDMVHPEMIMIGTEDGSTTGDAKQLINFYQTMMKNDPRYEIGTWDECECIKVFYNTFISAKIGLVNMMQDVAQKQGNINVDVVTNALAKSTMRIMGPQYMTAGMGDAGACHPRDNNALRWLAEEYDIGYDLFDTVMHAREMQAKNLAMFLVDQARQHGMSIVIHGKAYKPEVPYCVGSYSTLIGHYIKQAGFNVRYLDPLADDATEVISELAEPAVILWAHNRKITYEYTGDQPDTLPYCAIPTNSVIVDPWRKLPVIEGLTVIHYGNTRNF